MKKLKKSMVLFLLPVVMFTGCKPEVVAHRAVEELGKVSDQMEVQSDGSNETENDWANGTFESYYNINKVIDEHAVEMTFYRTVEIPAKDYKVGDMTVANDGRNYEIVSYEEAVENTCSFTDETQKEEFEEMFRVSGISHSIAVYIPESTGKFDYDGYYLVAGDDSNAMQLYEVSTEGPEPLICHDYETAPEIYIVADDAEVTILNFVDDESISMEEQLNYHISVADFMQGNFPETAFYHQAEDYYYYKDIDGKDSYSYGFCEVKNGIVTKISEIYQP